MLSNFIQDKHRCGFYPYIGNFSQFLLNYISCFLQQMSYCFSVLSAVIGLSCSQGGSLITFGTIQEKTYTNQKQNIPCSVISAVGTIDDYLLSLVLLLNCKELFISSDSQMKPENVNKDPDCTARHAQWCHRALARRQPGFPSSCSKDASKMHSVHVLKANRRREQSVLICIAFLRQGEAWQWIRDAVF